MQVPAADDNLGRRGDIVLLQGQVEVGATGLVRLVRSVSDSEGQETAGVRDRTDRCTGQQLVQESPPEGPSSRN